MSVELVLMRVDPGNKGLSVIDLFELVAQQLRDVGQSDDLAELSQNGDSFRIKLPGGTAVVHFEHAVFPIHELDAFTLRVAFSILRAGRMVAITEGGNTPVVLAESTQRRHLPETEWQNSEQSPVCRTPAGFKRQIQQWFANHKNFADRAFPPAEVAASVTSAAEEKSASVQIEKPRILLGDEWRSDVFLHHFNRSGYHAPKAGNILPQLAQAASIVLGGDGVVMVKDHDCVKIELPTGSGLLRAHGAVFDLSDVDILTSATLLQIAKAGDMAVITRKPKGVQTILADRSQWPLIPKNWRTTPEFCSICNTPQELMERLRCQLELDFPINQRAIFGAHTPDPLPGTIPIIQETVYLEVKPTSISASKHQDSLFKYLGRECRARSASSDMGGMLGTHSRKLMTPMQRVFFAYSYTAGCKICLELVQKFASSQGLLTAQIVNFDTLTQSDGVCIPMSECFELDMKQ